jgi:hypothetical protein
VKKRLLILGGTLNFIFTIFHFFLGYDISLANDLKASHQELMLMLNAAGTLFVLFFTVASAGFTGEMLETRLGRLIILFILIFYGSRAIEELLISNDFSPLNFVFSLAVALVYAIIYYDWDNQEEKN